jgi:isopenicillin N synthase-like dioxygenase
MRAADDRAVPVDLSGWFSGDDEARDRIAALVDAACAGSGFLAVTGHGIEPGLVADMLATSQAFFDLPLADKLRYRPDDLEGNRGYAPEGTEALSYSLGVESPPDLFEAFNIGREVPPPGKSAEQRRLYFAPNIWPDVPPRMREVWLDYWAACEQLGFVLLDVFARALGLPDGWFRPFHDRSISVMRANNYQRRPGAPPAAEGQQRMGAHSDYGTLTILLADRVPGLQIRDAEGAWHDVLPPEDGLLVNLGDLLAEWTNDRWRSTVHRVVPPRGRAEGDARRRSIAWFQQPNHDAVIEVLPSCCDDANPPRYPPTTSGEHLMAKLMGPRARREVDVADAFLH